MHTVTQKQFMRSMIYELKSSVNLLGDASPRVPPLIMPSNATSICTSDASTPTHRSVIITSPRPVDTPSVSIAAGTATSVNCTEQYNADGDDDCLSSQSDEEHNHNDDDGVKLSKVYM